MKKQYIFETIRYNRPDFDGYKGEINVSVNFANTNIYIKGEKYINRLETLKDLKKWLKENKLIIDNSLTKFK